MTSDAKVGLLLGLIFIFIIAFVLNGLPRFRNAANNSELTTNMVNSQNDNLGIGTRERKAQEFVDLQQQNSEPAFEEIPAPTESTEDIRYTMELPKSMYAHEDTPNTEIAEKDEPVSYNPFEPIVSASVVEEQPEIDDKAQEDEHDQPDNAAAQTAHVTEAPLAFPGGFELLFDGHHNRFSLLRSVHSRPSKKSNSR